MKQELLKGLTEEQIAKVKACKNHADLLQLAKDEDVELTDAQLAAVSGGMCSTPSITCPKCGSSDTSVTENSGSVRITYYCTCRSCGHKWSC